MTRKTASPGKRLRVLLLAADCNPTKPSLPVVGYKYARAMSAFCDVTVATHLRNRESIRAAHPEGSDAPALSFDFIDVRYVARPLRRIANRLRGGNEVAWSTNMMMAYPAQVEFERQIWKRYRRALEAEEYDVVHRITPMSPTMPSYMSGRGPQPFVLGPLNGNLDWPAAYAEEQKRERESLRKLRGLYKALPFVRRTYRRADCVLAAFQHTMDDLPSVPPERMVMFPEVGYDDDIFHAPESLARDPAQPMRFLFAGRLVPYKLPEVAVRAFAGSPALRDNHYLHIVGSGPELPRLKKIVADHGAEDRVIFEGRLTQSEVADKMRETDVFVFPSIRELGAGVVVEAMACGMLCLAVDYGGPADLLAPERGVKVPLAGLEPLTAAFRSEMERFATERGSPPQQAMRQAAVDHARDRYLWHRKAEFTTDIYRRLLAGEAKFPEYYR